MDCRRQDGRIVVQRHSEGTNVPVGIPLCGARSSLSYGHPPLKRIRVLRGGGKGARYHAPKTMYGGFFAPLRSARNDGSGEGFPLGGSSAAGGDEEYVEKHVLPLIRQARKLACRLPPKGKA